MTNSELLFQLKEILINANQNDKIANWILMSIYNLNNYLDLINVLPIEATKINECNQILDEYLMGKPLSRILGNTNFYSNKFFVDEGVFCPRNETELLVDKLIEYINKLKIKYPIKLLDMCCGTGVIGISIKLHFLDSLDLTLVDINKNACTNSEKNLQLHNINANVIHSDLFDNVSDKFDIIVCNPPYISFKDDIGVVKKYDPLNALFAENDGYLIYERIIHSYLNYINNNQNYLLAFEIGKGQEETIKNLLLLNDSNINIDIIKDYNNINRFIFVYKDNDI